MAASLLFLTEPGLFPGCHIRFLLRTDSSCLTCSIQLCLSLLAGSFLFGPCSLRSSLRLRFGFRSRFLLSFRSGSCFLCESLFFFLQRSLLLLRLSSGDRLQTCCLCGCLAARFLFGALSDFFLFCQSDFLCGSGACLRLTVQPVDFSLLLRSSLRSGLLQRFRSGFFLGLLACPLLLLRLDSGQNIGFQRLRLIQLHRAFLLQELIHRHLFLSGIKTLRCDCICLGLLPADRTGIQDLLIFSVKQLLEFSVLSIKCMEFIDIKTYGLRFLRRLSDRGLRLLCRDDAVKDLGDSDTLRGFPRILLRLRLRSRSYPSDRLIRNLRGICIPIEVDVLSFFNDIAVRIL